MAKLHCLHDVKFHPNKSCRCCLILRILMLRINPIPFYIYSHLIINNIIFLTSAISNVLTFNMLVWYIIYALLKPREIQNFNNPLNIIVFLRVVSLDFVSVVHIDPSGQCTGNTYTCLLRDGCTHWRYVLHFQKNVLPGAVV